MKRLLMLGLGIALPFAGCAHTVHDEHMAAKHEYRAARANASGDEYKAEREADKAERYEEKANRERPPEPLPPPLP